MAGEARAKSIKAVADALDNERGANAASLAVAENYVKAFGNLAKSSNTLLLPSNVGDVSSMVSQAMAIYKKVDGMKVESVESGIEKNASSDVTSDSATEAKN